MSDAASVLPAEASAEVHQLIRKVDVEDAPIPYDSDEDPWLDDDHRWRKDRSRRSWIEQDQTDLDDNVLRYSFKGIQPEVYSKKKEFIYTSPLVEKQLQSILKSLQAWHYSEQTRIIDDRPASDDNSC